MIYSELNSSETLSQGDIIDECPIVIWQKGGDTGQYESTTVNARVVILMQACDLAQAKADSVAVAVVHEAKTLVDSGIIKAQTVRDQIRTHRVWGWYFLPSGDELVESIVDLRNLHTVPRAMLEALSADGRPVFRLVTPYREHMAQHFSTTYSRIGLPEPYQSE